MVILDAPFASQPLVEWLEETGHPVLENDFAQSLADDDGADLTLVNDVQAANLLRQGERLYTNSENALAWLAEHLPDSPLNRTAALFKDKAATRRKLAALDPDYSFETVDEQDLFDLDPATLPLPAVLKPAVGFCSMGVYVIETPADWDAALAAILRQRQQWRARWPESVVDTNTWLIEAYVDGEEYAIDAYFDHQGHSQVLNVWRHDFADAEDTSDRLYVTSSAIAQAMAPRFQAWLSRVNEVVGAADFPLHVEVRVQGDRIVPIEFNPLRFAGLGGTDLAFYGFGLRTYAAFLEGRTVDLPALLTAEDGAGRTFAMALLTPPAAAGTHVLERAFDYDGLRARFTRPLALSRFDAPAIGAWGFLFLEASGEDDPELDFLLHADLTQFVK